MRDHALIENGVFQNYVKKPSIGDPIGLPAGVKILPVMREPKPTYNELTHRLEEDGGQESNGTWLIGWNQVALAGEELSDAVRRKYPDADAWRVKQWLLEQKGKDRAAVVAKIALAVPDPAQQLAAIQRYDIVPIVPFNHPLTTALAAAFEIDLAAEWEEISTYK